MSDSREAAAEIGNDNLEVRVALRVSTDDAPSIGAILHGAQSALHGALTALEIPGVEAVMARWHESMAVEAREAGDF